MPYRYWNTWCRNVKRTKAFGLWSALLLCFGAAIGQNSLQHSYGAFLQSGYVLPTNDFVRGENTDHQPINQVFAFSFRYTLHTGGERAWHQLYNYPIYGLGVYTAEFNLPNQLGSPIALYGFFSKDLISKSRWRLVGDYGLGIAMNWRYFTPEHPERIAIGSAITCYIDASFVFKRELSSNADLGLGLSFTHFSNGAIAKPNKGLNLLTSRISVDYKPKKLKPRTVQTLPIFTPHSVDMLTAFAGSHSVLTTLSPRSVDEPNSRRSYFVFGLDRRMLYRFSPKHALGLGFGLGYNQYVGTTYRIFDRKLEFYGINHAKRINVSAYLSYEYRINRLGIVIEPGIYLYKHKQDNSRLMFQRIGLRYTCKNEMLLGINLRAAYFTVAKYIEFTLGYAIDNR